MIAKIIVCSIEIFNFLTKKNINERTVKTIICAIQRFIIFPSPSTILHNDEEICIIEAKRTAR